MSEDNSPERQRQERARLVNTFTRRAWQPSEQPQVGPRALAGGVAVVVVAGVAFGLGAMKSYNDKKSAEEHARQLALTAPSGQTVSNPALSPSAGSTTGENPGRSGAGPQVTGSPSAGRQGGPGRPVPFASSSRSNSPSRPSVSPVVSGTQAVAAGTANPNRRLAVLAAQQGGETAPYIVPLHPAAPTPTPTPAKSSERAVTVTSARKKSARGAGPRMSTIRGVVIKNVMTGKCVDVSGYDKGSPNGPVEQYTCDGSRNDNQRWDLVVSEKGAGPDGADLFTIRNSKDGLCFDLPGFGQVQKAGVTEYTCNPGSGDNQMWYLQAKGKGQFWIRSTGAGDRCLDVSGLHGSGGNGANLTVYPCDVNDDHLWSFI